MRCSLNDDIRNCSFIKFRYDLVLGELVPLLHQVLSADASLAVKNVACEALVVVAPHIRFAVRPSIEVTTF